jgi:hypothetical protein
MSHLKLPGCEPNSTSTLPEQPGVLQHERLQGSLRRARESYFAKCNQVKRRGGVIFKNSKEPYGKVCSKSWQAGGQPAREFLSGADFGEEPKVDGLRFSVSALR